MAFPEYLLQHNVRDHHRIVIPPRLRTKCIVDRPGHGRFKLEITDISRAGLGIVVHDRNIKLKPGAELTGCRIVQPLGSPIAIDLQILYASAVRLADGSLQARAGCRFIGDAVDVRDLIGMFSCEIG